MKKKNQGFFEKWLLIRRCLVNIINSFCLGSGMNPDGGATCALHAASAGGHLIIVHLLISAGAHKEVLDKSQYTPLMLAILNNHNEIVKYLIKAGADPQFKVKYLNKFNPKYLVCKSI